MELSDIVNYLIDKKLSIATMESCTGGLLASLITDVPGASDIMKFSAVTYCNEYKIKMGVSAEVIDKYTVYSEETSREMAYNISKFAGSDIGVGITGRLVSKSGTEKSVDLCIFDKRSNSYYHVFKSLQTKTRRDNKLEVIEEFKKLFNSTILK